MYIIISTLNLADGFKKGMNKNDFDVLGGHHVSAYIILISLDLRNFSLCSVNSTHSVRMCFIVKVLSHPTQNGGGSLLRR